MMDPYNHVDGYTKVEEPVHYLVRINPPDPNDLSYATRIGDNTYFLSTDGTYSYEENAEHFASGALAERALAGIVMKREMCASGAPGPDIIECSCLRNQMELKKNDNE